MLKVLIEAEIVQEEEMLVNHCSLERIQLLSNMEPIKNGDRNRFRRKFAG